MVEVTMPPMIGVAIGRMTSEPVPVDQKIGASERVAAATVIPEAGPPEPSSGLPTHGSMPGSATDG